jgi:predicted  nucleic acid-binding Zn-ribbon protein
MNAERRKAIDQLRAEIDALKTRIGDLAGEEASYRDDLPENMQDGEKYDKADAAVDALEAAQDSLNDAMEELDEAVNQ